VAPARLLDELAVGVGDDERAHAGADNASEILLESRDIGRCARDNRRPHDLFAPPQFYG
jgi:hypothetical protein